MKILILSDLHIGNKARAKELCPYPEGVHKDDNLVASFLTKAKAYQLANGNFDYLVIPGDITNQSHLIEYDCGTKFLTKVLLELQIDKSKVIFVPGNHDIDWSVLEGASIKDEEKVFRRSHKYNTLKDPNHVFSFLSAPDLLIEPYIKRWEFDDIVFFGFNSAWHDDAFEKNHYGLIQADQIAQLRQQLESTDLNKLKFFIVHHHLHAFSNPHPAWRDISLMQNGQALLDLLTEFGFDFIIHGHRHQPNFLSTSINHSKHLNILCAGSYCCELPTTIAGHIGNLFHILEIDELDKCKGKILSLAYNSRDGWVESREHDGIEHENPFGNELEYDELLKLCSEEINLAFQTQHFVLCSDLVSKVPDLKYLQVSQRKKLFDELEKNCKAKKAVDSSKETIFIKL